MSMKNQIIEVDQLNVIKVDQLNVMKVDQVNVIFNYIKSDSRLEYLNFELLTGNHYYDTTTENRSKLSLLGTSTHITFHTI